MSSNPALNDPATVQAIVSLLAQVNDTITRLINLSNTAIAAPSSNTNGGEAAEKAARAEGGNTMDPDNAALSPQNDTRELDVPCIVTEDSVAVTAPRAESERWYAVIVGRQPGVHRGYGSIEQDVYEIPKSIVRMRHSYEEAVNFTTLLSSPMKSFVLSSSARFFLLLLIFLSR
ncbi:hypothetical protein FA13DRAFT_1787219 [Coprinellus micaceus]|uniref:Ribonuclease H1 N-terminal domain-containing protein n=1 Tax=Coprinellus micaceus TaxID=71717 RepID=A0A4Y7TRW0_COPMI|nr:hypothetical protein FA13DRAFT_1787219 [Coprinellus micaceus]